MSDSEVVLAENSPLGNVFAQVEDDGRVVFLYLAFQEDGQEEPSELKTCWVRNRQSAPAKLDEDGMEQGIPPLMPREFCRHPNGQPSLDQNHLRIVWLEELNGVALLESNEIIAILPPWSGESGFHGYARDCISEGPLAWPLHADNDLHARVRQAEEYWKLWDDDSFWSRYSAALIHRLEAAFGPHAKYYAIDGGKWPPKALLRFDLPDRYVLVTAGVSLLPQPGAERWSDQPSDIRRIELALAVDKNCPVDDVKRLGSCISRQASYPWSAWSWLGTGHTVDFNTPQSCGGKQFAAALLTTRLPNTPQIKLPSFRGDPINLLWCVPITDAEREWAKDHGSDELIDQLTAAGIDVTVRRRTELSLP